MNLPENPAADLNPPPQSNANILLDIGEEVNNPASVDQPFATGLLRIGKCVLGTVMIENPSNPDELQENAVLSFDSFVSNENYAFRQDETGDTIFNSGGNSIYFNIKGETGMVLTRTPTGFTLTVNGDVSANNIP